MALYCLELSRTRPGYTRVFAFLFLFHFASGFHRRSVMPPLPAPAAASRPYRGSTLLASCAVRVTRVLVPVLLLWGLAGWAMDWW